MKLILAEKPELASAIVQALYPNAVKNKGYFKEGNTIVINSFGHLLELVEPEYYDKRYADKKDISYLPVYFRNWKKQPAQDMKDSKGNKIDQSYKRIRFKLIKELLSDADEVIHAGDPDDEGQLLIDELLEYCHYQGPVKRVFINDNLPKNIQKAFAEAEDNKKYICLGNAAYARQMGDKCFGINESRLISHDLKRYLNLGRVMNPLLGLVYNRDKAISRHVKETYYTLSGNGFINNALDSVKFDFSPNSELLDDGKRILNRNTLEEIKKSLLGFASTLDFKETIEEEATPLPYDTASLEGDMNGKFGYSLAETMAITQSLREKRLITYNRSDCMYLREEHFAEAPRVLPVIMKNLGRQYPLDFSIHSRCFNDEMVEVHHGIIPQEISYDLNQLSEKERNVYRAIAERYIMQFLPPVKKAVSKSNINVNSGKLKYSCSKIISLGYKKYFKDEDDSDKSKNIFVSEGNYKVKFTEWNIEEKETKPLSKYTEKSLIKDMCSISKYVADPEIKKILKEKDKGKAGENGSIGTSATRHEILNKLFNYGYLKHEGKYVVTTDLGKEVYELLPENIKSADITAKWWLLQEAVKEGKADVNSIMESVVEEFKAHENFYKNKELAKSSESVSGREKETFGFCPVCGHPVYKAVRKGKDNFYYCSDYKNGCTFTLNENFKRFNDVIKLTDSKVAALLNGKSISAEVTLKSGKKARVNLKLTMNQYNGKAYSNLEIAGFR